MSTADAAFGFQNTYVNLPERFHARVNPAPVAAPKLIKLNTALADELGITGLTDETAAQIFSGNAIAEGSEPLAIAYAGHQFGHFVPQLGDGRANLLGEVVARDGKRYDIQLKGSGRTPFSRRGDGRAALGPVLREYLVSEAMHALGVPTSRALAAVLTGETVLRDPIAPGAIITRVAGSHLRVGTFQYFAARQDTEGLLKLAAFAAHRHYPAAGNAPKPIRALLDSVVAAQARLTAQWMNLGFIHGVMNTDNSSISGETLDYGPCAFLEAYDPAKVFSSIDMNGRYSYENQPNAAHWNLARLAEALLPLLTIEYDAQEAALEAAYASLNGFADLYEGARLDGLRRKLGLLTAQTGDAELAEELLSLMAANQADFTLTSRRLVDAAADPAADAAVRELFANPAAYDGWAARWHARLAAEAVPATNRRAVMAVANPSVIPRNHYVAEVIRAAEGGDFQPFEYLLAAVTQPFTENPRYMAPATPGQCVTQTFCGT